MTATGRVMTGPLLAVLTAQFFSAFADNALLITAIALLKQSGDLGVVPLLQASFVVPFILLAPYVGVLADGFAKGRVMLVANGVKLAGAGVLALGGAPLLGYAMAGVGAAAYSPAKYGILRQLCQESHLVKANGLMEGTTIVAILTGVVAGGWLADTRLSWAFAGVMMAYAIAAIANLLIPAVPVERPITVFHPGRLLVNFWQVLRVAWRDRDIRFSLLGTGTFWGTGTTLRLALFAWVPAALLITDNQMPANLMGAVSLGIVAGAATAGILVGVDKVNRALWGGLALGPLVMLLALQTDIVPAVALLVLVGAAGGFFVVPLNTLLQIRGHLCVGSGNALAIQNLVENLIMLLFVMGYHAASSLPVVPVVVGVGGMVLLALGTLAAARGTPVPGPAVTKNGL